MELGDRTERARGSATARKIAVEDTRVLLGRLVTCERLRKRESGSAADHRKISVLPSRDRR